MKLIDTIGIPEEVLELIESIPRGKGMAGQAWLNKKPVTTCNLKTDPSQTIQPGARSVDARSAIAIPIADENGVHSVVGFAFKEDRDFGSGVVDKLSAIAARICAHYEGS